ncbi:MAG: hypothetical protein QOG87_2202 [Actinomycetota bacterium]
MIVRLDDTGEACLQPEMRLQGTVTGHRKAIRMVVALLVLVVGVIGFGIAQRSHSDARKRTEERFRVRGHLAARFMATYIRQITSQEQEQARRYWADHVPDDQEFQQFVDAFGFQAAVLLDKEGRLLRVVPAGPEILGRPLAGHYDHLTAALNGTITVSDVVPSAAQSQPVVAFAVPLVEGGEATVFSGAFEVQATPLAAFLSEASPVGGSANYLVDSKNIVAATNARRSAGKPLREAAPALADASARGRSGLFGADGESTYYVSETVSGTGWRVILAAPTAALYAPVDDTRRGSLALAAALGIAAVAVGVLFLRNSAAREALEAVTRTDVLTGLANRRHMEEFLSLALAAGARRGHEVGVLMADIDHFKQVNDKYGHRAGDAVLADVGARLAMSVRRDEFVGRWGGEEFLVVLPVTDAEAAHRAAERLRRVISEHRPADRDDGLAQVTMSVGCAVGEGDLDDLVQAADEALYAAKSAGRNRVAMASDAPMAPNLGEL